MKAVLFIWDKEPNKVFTKMLPEEEILYKKEFKINGRKPNKLIVHHELMANRKFMRHLKKLTAYNAVIVPYNKGNKHENK